MSVLVKGMDMPETCHKCPVVGYEFFDSRNGFANGYYKCNALNKNIEDVMHHGRLRDCPLFELKDWREMRLIDAMPTIDPQRTGEWIDYSEDGYVECPFCHSATNCDDNIDELHFCFSCGAKMEKPEDIPMEYFESGGR